MGVFFKVLLEFCNFHIHLPFMHSPLQKSIFRLANFSQSCYYRNNFYYPKSFISSKSCYSTEPIANDTSSVFKNSLDELAISPKVASIVDSIATLSLLETGQLVSLLKKRLNLTADTAPVSMGAPASPVAGAAPSMGAAEIKTAAAPIEEQTEFKVTLVSFDAAAKAKIIREIKGTLSTLNLVEAKNFVEGAPKVIKEKTSKEDAEKLKKSFEALGATIKIE